ncbi:MAG: M20/M25/M40 family metallo-hydrolase [Acidimicrobiia bacterium]|nr:M20/M25/M40 family metallo-hydrolase [Acidimicrobiia bacterium]
MDEVKGQRLIADLWADEIVPQLHAYIEIPALSPAFDPVWERSGHIEQAVQLVVDWMQRQPIEGMAVNVQRLDGRTPLVVAEIEPFGPSGGSLPEITVLYGHLDKQPEMIGWDEGLGPWTPVMRGTRLYGRGGADDGYAVFASLAAVAAVQAAGGSHGRLLVLIEASEESGSHDLPAHIDALSDRLGDVGLVVCLDSGCANYDTLWLTTSLRGVVSGRLQVDIVTQGLHSGGYGGVVPSTFRIIRRLLDRVEDAADGRILIEAANVEIPAHRVAEAESTAALLGQAALRNVPFVEGAGPAVDTVVDGLLAKTWRPSLSYIGADGLPPTGQAGNVLRPSTTLKLSLRIPPTADPELVKRQLARTLTVDPPYGAAVVFEGGEAAPGWNAPDLSPWLQSALDQASKNHFGQPMQLYGEGGTIPFMGMLGEKFPSAQFVITGVLGPGSNAHGPNEFIDVAYAETLTGCLAAVLDASTRR